MSYPPSTPAEAGVQHRSARNLAPRFAGVVALLLGGCVSERTVTVARPAPPAAAAADAIPPAYQFLYGSGEAGALQQSAFHALIAYVKDKAAHRPNDSVVLAAGSPLVKATFVPCGAKPLAVVFDADETVLLNLGFEARAATGVPYSQREWDQWEATGADKVAETPGAGHAMAELRKLGIAAVINTNRRNEAATVAALKGAGLGDFHHGDTLFLQGDDDGGSRKDGRRATIAARYCVIAMAGDQLGDFSDRFADPMPVAARRQLAVHSSAAGLWGKGWFVLPNPAYGSGLKGGLDDAFPADKRWTPKDATP